jgi:hypothetical protein
MPLSKTEAHRRVKGLRESLELAVKRDPEQEVRGMAVPVTDAAFEAARAHLAADDPLALVATEVVSVDMIEAGEPLRAVDALVVARQLEEALYEPPRAYIG